MKSGMLAAEAIFDSLDARTLALSQPAMGSGSKDSWLWTELYKVRNIRPGFVKGLWLGLAHAAIDTYLLFGRAPWTLRHHADHAQLKPADQAPKIDYPKPDGKVSFDRNSSVYLSGTNHEEKPTGTFNIEKDSRVPIVHNLPFMMHQNSDTARLVFMRLSVMKRAVVHSYKSTRKIVCIAKHVTSRTRPKT